MELCGKSFIIYSLLALTLLGILLGIFLSRKEAEKYNLLVIGSSGQIEYFKQTHSDVISLRSLTNQQKIDKLFNNTTYDVTNGTCKISTLGKVLDLTNLDNVESINEGMRNFYEIISADNFKTNLNKADGVVFLGNAVIPEAELLSEKTVNKISTLGSQEKWNQRLICGWNVFKTHLQKTGLLNNGKLKDQVTFIVGVNGYDVSYIAENEIYKPMENTSKFSTFWTYDLKVQKGVVVTEADPTPYEWVKKTTVYLKERPITFLDIDTNYLLCIGLVENATDYTDQKKCKFTEDFINGRGSYEDVIRYYLSIYDLVSNMDSNHWNVIRGHHPPTNYEQGDTSIFWDVKINGKVYNLMEKFQEKNVRIYLSANTHAQSVMAIPFRKTKIRKREMSTEIIPNGEYCNPYNLREISNELLNTSIKCAIDVFNVDLKSENIMLVFNNGNSGRTLDPIYDGSESERGNLVWTKKTEITVNSRTNDAFGFGNVEFEKDKLTYKFYESSLSFFNNKIDTTIASTFNVKFNEVVNSNFK
jgi:hypothetical protein